MRHTIENHHKTYEGKNPTKIYFSRYNDIIQLKEFNTHKPKHMTNLSLSNELFLYKKYISTKNLFIIYMCTEIRKFII